MAADGSKEPIAAPTPSSSDVKAVVQIPPSGPTSLDSIAFEAGTSIAEGILARVKEFPKRESFLSSLMTQELESVPSQILWRGLEEEAAPVFVVYKLLHEAFSSTPSFFRRFITRLMAAQPDRFATVFNRETLWSVVARLPGYELPETWASPAVIRCLLEALNRKGFWRRSDEELAREAESISSALTRGRGDFRDGVEALRRLQAERSTGLTSGNLLLFVPPKLNQYVSEVAELGMRGHLPSFEELCAKVHEVVRDPLGEGRHQSIPIDLLFTEPTGNSLECFLLVREKAGAAEQIELRKKSLLVRYFLKFAFSAYDTENLNVRLAFYLDPHTTFSPLPEHAMLFHQKELIEFEEFWKVVTGKKDGMQLALKARDAAAEKLRSSIFMTLIKDHFSRDRKPKSRTQDVLFDQP